MIRVVIKCDTCGAKLGHMHITPISGGSVKTVKGYIEPRVKFYCEQHKTGN